MDNGREIAQAFAQEHAHHTEDLALWQQVAQRYGGPILDLGSASGRVALPLARDGHEVWALDGDPHMLSVLAEQAAEDPAVAARLHTVMHDMRDFSLTTRFPLVIGAMNTLQVLHEPADHVACLECVRRHLTDDGEFWFDLVLADIADVTGAMGLVRAGVEYHDPDTGECLIHSSWYEGYDAATQNADYALRIDRVDAAGMTRTVVRRHRVHLFTPNEVEHLVARAGMVVRQRWGGFAGEPLEDGAAHQVYRCGVAG